jgi:predicted nucleic acid-binding protein
VKRTQLYLDDDLWQALRLRARQFHASHAVELGDALIAATASVHTLRLWTRNRKHFPMRDAHHF